MSEHEDELPGIAAALLVRLKEECEEQHARAEKVEARLASVRALIEKYRYAGEVMSTYTVIADELDAALKERD